MSQRLHVKAGDVNFVAGARGLPGLDRGRRDLYNCKDMQMTDKSKAAEVLAALGSAHRLRIVELLCQGECCVCELTPDFKLDPSVVSRHLAVLEEAGIIVSRRSGRWIHYRIADRQVLRLLDAARQMAGCAKQARPRAKRTIRKRRPC